MKEGTMIEGDRTTRPRPSKIGELIQGTAKLPVPKLTLDWERRAKILEQEVAHLQGAVLRQGENGLMQAQIATRQQDTIEAQARQIVDLKEELHQQDERIKLLEARVKTMGVLVAL